MPRIESGTFYIPSRCSSSEHLSIWHVYTSQKILEIRCSNRELWVHLQILISAGGHLHMRKFLQYMRKMYGFTEKSENLGENGKVQFPQNTCTDDTAPWEPLPHARMTRWEEGNGRVEEGDERWIVEWGGSTTVAAAPTGCWKSGTEMWLEKRLPSARLSVSHWVVQLTPYLLILLTRWSNEEGRHGYRAMEGPRLGWGWSGSKTKVHANFH